MTDVAPDRVDRWEPESTGRSRGYWRANLLRDVSENRALGDTTTLAEPAVVDEIKQRAVTERDKED